MYVANNFWEEQDYFLKKYGKNIEKGNRPTHNWRESINVPFELYKEKLINTNHPSQKTSKRSYCLDGHDLLG